MNQKDIGGFCVLDLELSTTLELNGINEGYL
jgi:hypothetical protein